MLTSTMHTTLNALHEGLASGIADLSAEQTQRRPKPDAWSVQQITEHLLITYTLTAQNFEARAAKGTATRTEPTLADRLGQFYICTLGMFPKGRKAPGNTEPTADAEPQSGKALAARARSELERLDAAAAAAERLFGGQAAIVHPVLGPMSVQGWRRFHLMHGRHHLRQIHALRGHAS